MEPLGVRLGGQEIDTYVHNVLIVYVSYNSAKGIHRFFFICQMGLWNKKG